MLLSLVLLLPALCITAVSAAGSASVPLHRRGRVNERDGGEASKTFLEAELARTRQKFGYGTAQDRRRAVAEVPLTEESGDASFFAKMSIGGSSFEIVLDTGSAVSVVSSSTEHRKASARLCEGTSTRRPTAPRTDLVAQRPQDLVLATTGCSSCGSTTPLYSPGASASVTTTPFAITYGTGSASGLIVNDTVSMAGFTVQSQVSFTPQ